MEKDVKGFKTSDLPLASYLYCKGMTILGTVPDKVDPKRKNFVFVDTPERDSWVDEFVSGNDLMSARQYFKATREVRRYLYEQTNS